MDQRRIIRYSSSFKFQVVEELESGKFSSISQAMAHYGITGGETIKGWLKRYGKNHLIAKVIRVEKPNEIDEIKKLKREIRQLKEALGDTQAERILEKEFLNIACRKLGENVDDFKKKADLTLYFNQKKQDE